MAHFSTLLLLGGSVRATVIKAERSSSKLRNQQGAAKHGDIFHEENHLDLRHHGIGYGPELVQHQGDRNQEQHDEPAPTFARYPSKMLRPPAMATTPERGTAIPANGTP